MLNNLYRMCIYQQRLSAVDLIGCGQRCCLFLNKLVLSSYAGHPVRPLYWRASQGDLTVFPFWLLSSQFTCWWLSVCQEPQLAPWDASHHASDTVVVSPGSVSDPSVRWLIGLCQLIWLLSGTNLAMRVFCRSCSLTVGQCSDRRTRMDSVQRGPIVQQPEYAETRLWLLFFICKISSFCITL